MSEPVVHKDCDRIDLKTLCAPTESSVGWWVPTPNNINPKRLLWRRPEKVNLDAEIVLLRKFLHPRQRSFDHFGNGWDFHTRVSAQN
jgi:hypothetical protein